MFLADYQDVQLTRREIDYNPKNLTNWGYSEVAYDLSINQGCVFYKLLLRALPDYFKPDSIYAHVGDSHVVRTALTMASTQ